MTRVGRQLLLAVAAMLVWACGDREREIREVARAYVEATGNYRLEEAKQYASCETRERLLPFMQEKIMPLVDTAYIQANTPATAEVDSLRRDGDTVWVAYTKTTPSQRTHGELRVVREGGRWVVHVPLVLAEDEPEAFENVEDDRSDAQ